MLQADQGMNRTGSELQHWATEFQALVMIIGDSGSLEMEQLLPQLGHVARFGSDPLPGP